MENKKFQYSEEQDNDRRRVELLEGTVAPWRKWVCELKEDIEPIATSTPTKERHTARLIPVRSKTPPTKEPQGILRDPEELKYLQTIAKTYGIPDTPLQQSIGNPSNMATGGPTEGSQQSDTAAAEDQGKLGFAQLYLENGHGDHRTIRRTQSMSLATDYPQEGGLNLLDLKEALETQRHELLTYTKDMVKELNKGVREELTAIMEIVKDGKEDTHGKLNSIQIAIDKEASKRALGEKLMLQTIEERVQEAQNDLREGLNHDLRQQTQVKVTAKSSSLSSQESQEHPEKVATPRVIGTMSTPQQGITPSGSATRPHQRPETHFTPGATTSPGVLGQITAGVYQSKKSATTQMPYGTPPLLQEQGYTGNQGSTGWKNEPPLEIMGNIEQPGTQLIPQVGDPPNYNPVFVQNSRGFTPHMGNLTYDNTPLVKASHMAGYKGPEPFSMPTAYKSAKKFINEYRFYAESVHRQGPNKRESQARMLYGYLKGRAKQWYETHVFDKPLIYDLEGLYREFIEHFSKEDPDTLLKGYRARKQGKDESVTEYINDMILLLANSKLDEETQVDYLINGLRPEIGNVVRMDTPDKIHKVETAARKQELSIAANLERMKEEQAAKLNEISHNNDEKRGEYRKSRDSWRQKRDKGRKEDEARRDNRGRSSDRYQKYRDRTRSNSASSYYSETSRSRSRDSRPRTPSSDNRDRKYYKERSKEKHKNNDNKKKSSKDWKDYKKKNGDKGDKDRSRNSSRATSRSSSINED